MALLAVARFLVARVPFGLWRASLGQVAGNADAATASAHELAVAGACAMAVRRAAHRLPGTLCLPQAMVLQWMLRRRGVPAILLMGVAGQGVRRGRLGDLHAWLEVGGTALLDDGGGIYQVLLRLGTGLSRCNIDPASQFD